jgi:hypothetical protein
VYEDAGEDPPCDECGRPDYLPSNRRAWKVWDMCSNFERPAAMGGVMAIPATSVIQIVKEYGGGERDVDKVLFIESKMLPYIREQAKSQSSST